MLHEGVSMANIFISYSRQDDTAVSEFVEEMSKDENLKISKDIPVGERWSDSIELAIEDSDAIIFLVSPAFLSSPYCQYELGFALGQNKISNTPVLPIIIKAVDDNAMPTIWKDKITIDATKMSKQRLRDLVKSYIEKRK
jgi:hypothetical protein